LAHRSSTVSHRTRERRGEGDTHYKKQTHKPYHPTTKQAANDLFTYINTHMYIHANTVSPPFLSSSLFLQPSNHWPPPPPQTDTHTHKEQFSLPSLSPSSPDSTSQPSSDIHTHTPAHTHTHIHTHTGTYKGHHEERQPQQSCPLWHGPHAVRVCLCVCVCVYR
jgi:hypothetical protein